MAVMYWATLAVPLVLQVQPRWHGVLIHTVGAVIVVLAMRANPFFVPSITWLPGQYFVRKGIYRFGNHPGYTGFALMAIGNAMACGWAATIPACFYLAFLFHHFLKEVQFLKHYAKF